MGSSIDNLTHAAMQTMLAVQLNNNNLANANSIGYKEDHVNFEPVLTAANANAALVGSANNLYYNLSQGHINVTNRNLDVALGKRAFLAIQSPEGREVYSKAGNLQISGSRFLVDGNGNYVLGEQGGPISIPPAQAIQIGDNGAVMVEPEGAENKHFVEVGRLKMVTPPMAELVHTQDGYFTLPDNTRMFENPTARLKSGELEGSNVNPVESMVNLIELSRNYDQYIKIIRMQTDNNIDAQRILTE